MDWLRFLPLAGRVLIGASFMFSGAGKIAAYDGTVAYITATGLPFAPLGWALAIVIEIGAGALLILGLNAKAAALLLALFCVATAVLFHHNFADRNQMVHFFLNIMIVGGLLQIIYFGPGPFSWRARTIQSSTA